MTGFAQLVMAVSLLATWIATTTSDISVRTVLNACLHALNLSLKTSPTVSMHLHGRDIKRFCRLDGVHRDDDVLTR